MAVLLVLLLLSNLWFGWAADSAGSSSSSNSVSSVPDIAAFLQQLQNIQKNKEETCEKIKSAISSIAVSKNWKVKSDQFGTLSIELPNGETYVINKDCSKVVAEVPVGTLSPMNEKSAAPMAQGTITREDFNFSVDVSLFRVLFQLLMYAAGIFWAVRAVQKLIAGDLTETLASLFIGFIIVASMYMLYKWMPV
jgi:hypothetical protein